jgi:ABC-type multidrug transport system ATPase subunit
VRGVDLTVGEGEIVGFLGPNGAGKTTTLRMLTTLLKPTAGTATVAGADLLRDPTHYLDEADALCDRVLIIDNGRIVAGRCGTTPPRRSRPRPPSQPSRRQSGERRDERAGRPRGRHHNEARPASWGR